MKILVSAVACNPYLGSENYFGWAAVKCLAEDHELWVLSSRRNEPDLQLAQNEGLVPKNVHFVHAGKFKPWHPNRMLARLQGWKEYLHYSKEILPVAEKLHREIGFDLAHHVTFATWRVASPLWKLGIPFVFGPIGGNEQFPLRFLPMLSPVAAAFEISRMLSNQLSGISPSVRACIRNAAHVFAATPETEVLARHIRGSDHGVSMLSAAVYSKEKIDQFIKASVLKNPHGPLHIFAGGNLEGRKGVALALRALALVKARGIQFHYTIGGTGPEAGKLKNLATELGLAQDVTFSNGFSGEEYRNQLGSSHIFLLPSFRESAGLTMMEAMLAGCVPIVADCGGPGYIVTEEAGIKLKVSNPARLVSGLADAITEMEKDRRSLKRKGNAASRRIADVFTTDNYRRRIAQIYGEIVALPSRIPVHHISS